MEAPEGYKYRQAPVKITCQYLEKTFDKRDASMVSKMFYNTV
jgi:hypothetical protein